jgi:hypothetical protein
VKKEYDFKGAARGVFAKTTSKRERQAALKRLRPRTMQVSFTVTREVVDALRALRDTGLFGNGQDCESVADELLRKALLDPNVVLYWRKT